MRRDCQLKIFPGSGCRLPLRLQSQDRDSPAGRHFSRSSPANQGCAKRFGLCCRSRRARKRNRSSKPARTVASPTTRADPAVEHHNGHRSEPSVCRRDVCCAPKRPGDPASKQLSIPIQSFPAFAKPRLRNHELYRQILRRSKRLEIAGRNNTPQDNCRAWPKRNQFFAFCL